MAKVVEHFFVFLRHLCFTFWELCIDLHPIYNWVLCFCVFSLSYTLDINPLSNILLCSLILCSNYAVLTIQLFMRSCLLIVGLNAYAIGVLFRKKVLFCAIVFQEYSPFSLLLDSGYLASCWGPWTICSSDLYRIK